jgi:hypothetical protein
MMSLDGKFVRETETHKEYSARRLLTAKWTFVQRKGTSMSGRLSLGHQRSAGAILYHRRHVAGIWAYRGINIPGGDMAGAKAMKISIFSFRAG